jgi:hypothetical protein
MPAAFWREKQCAQKILGEALADLSTSDGEPAVAGVKSRLVLKVGVLSVQPVVLGVKPQEANDANRSPTRIDERLNGRRK